MYPGREGGRAISVSPRSSAACADVLWFYQHDTRGMDVLCKQRASEQVDLW